MKYLHCKNSKCHSLMKGAMASLLILSGLASCRHAEAASTSDSATYSATGSSSQSEGTSSSPITSFMVGGKNVQLPSVAEFAPLLEKMGLGDSRVRSITFLGLTPSIGFGSMGDNFGPFLKARTYSEASKYSEPLSQYYFDSKQRITSLDQDPGIEMEFDYNQAGYPSVIAYEEEGYRGSPSYTLRYDITWQGSQATRIEPTVLEYESDEVDLDESELGPENLDFASDWIWDSIKALIASDSSTIKVNDNTCKVTGTDADGNPVTYWIKVECY